MIIAAIISQSILYNLGGTYNAYFAEHVNVTNEETERIYDQ